MTKNHSRAMKGNILFLDSDAIDAVEAPEDPGSTPWRPSDFADANGNGRDDGRETQANLFQALFNTMVPPPGILNGAFFWDNWIASAEVGAGYWAGQRPYAIRGKLAEQTVRRTYKGYKNR